MDVWLPKTNVVFPSFIVLVDRTNSDSAFVLCLCQEVWETHGNLLYFPDNTCSLHMREATACSLPRLKKHTSLPYRLSPNIFVPLSRPKIWWFLRFMFVKMCASVLADILLLDLHPIIATIIIITLFFF